MNDDGIAALVRLQARRPAARLTKMAHAPDMPIIFAAGHINASAAVPISEDDLVMATAAEVTPLSWRHHVWTFLDETDVETLSDIVRSGALTYAQLACAAGRHLPAEHPTRQWLDERA